MAKRILVVDDDEMNLMRTEMILEEDYEVLLADSGVRALHILRNQKIDLVLLDIDMPVMNGIETFQHMKEFADNIPVIFLTASGEVGDVVEALLLGAVNQVTKPRIDAAQKAKTEAAMAQVDVPWALQDPRTGVRIGRYIRSCSAMAGEVLAAVLDRLPDHSRILVLGTEECMFPALVLGKALERLELARSVAFHATTRSPIGICTQPGYPVTVGYKVHSFYSGERETYLYNLRQYDAAILLTDGMSQDATADIAKALYIHGCRKLLHVQGGSHVQFL